MFGEKALELIKELERSADSIPPFNDAAMKLVLDEMQILYEANRTDVEATVAGDTALYLSVQLRHVVLNRNKRCILAYLYNRLKRIRQMRWEFGSILPSEVNALLSKPEIGWLDAYGKSLAAYMRTIGENRGLNLTLDVLPPKSLYIEVRCLVDYGKFEFEDGQVVLLKKNTHHLLPRAQCEQLVRQGILRHVTS